MGLEKRRQARGQILALSAHLLYFSLLLFRLFLCLLGQSFQLLGCKLQKKCAQMFELNHCHKTTLH